MISQACFSLARKHKRKVIKKKKNFNFSATTIGTLHILLLKSLTEEK